MRKAPVLFAAVALMLGLAATAFAAVPTTIPYQGRLTDAGGTAINTAQSIRFSLWTAATAGTELWNETQPAVTVASGLFNVDLGSVPPGIPASVFSGSDLFLEIKVGADAAMTPRQRIGTVAYAMRSGLAPAVASATGGSVSPPGGLSNLTSITVTFPTSGFAVVTGVAAFGFTVPAGTHCFATNISDVSAASQGAFVNFHCVSQAGYSETNTSNYRVFTVAAGAKTFFLVGNNQQSDPWTVFGSRLTVMFFPDAIGTVTSTEPQPTPSSAQRVGNSQR